MNLEIRTLTTDLKEDYLSFFDNMVFEENPDRAKCYCYDYHFLGDVDAYTKEMSRSDVSQLIDKSVLRGYLAFNGDKVVGWCNVNDRSNYQRLLRDYDHVDNPNDKACSIVCFLIHPDHRRQGIARKILERIVEDHSGSDFDYLEAYPKKAEASCEGNFKGPLELYERFGFVIHKEYDDAYTLRKALT